MNYLLKARECGQELLNIIWYRVASFPRDEYGVAQRTSSKKLFIIYILAAARSISWIVQVGEEVHDRLLVVRQTCDWYTQRVRKLFVNI